MNSRFIISRFVLNILFQYVVRNCKNVIFGKERQRTIKYRQMAVFGIPWQRAPTPPFTLLASKDRRTLILFWGAKRKNTFYKQGNVEKIRVILLILGPNPISLQVQCIMHLSCKTGDLQAQFLSISPPRSCYIL